MGFFATGDRLLQPSKTRLVFLLIAAAAFIFTEFGRHVYCPYVRKHGIEDYGLTDSIGNLGGIIVQIFVGLAILNAMKMQSYRLAVFYSIGYVAYEFAQPHLPRGVFDWNDIYGTVIGFLVSVVILAAVWRHAPTETREPEG
jgi:hypothetical protein